MDLPKSYRWGSASIRSRGEVSGSRSARIPSETLPPIPHKNVIGLTTYLDGHTVPSYWRLSQPHEWPKKIAHHPVSVVHENDSKRHSEQQLRSPSRKVTLHTVGMGIGRLTIRPTSTSGGEEKKRQTPLLACSLNSPCCKSPLGRTHSCLLLSAPSSSSSSCRRRHHRIVAVIVFHAPRRTTPQRRAPGLLRT